LDSTHKIGLRSPGMPGPRRRLSNRMGMIFRQRPAFFKSIIASLLLLGWCACHRGTIPPSGDEIFTRAPESYDTYIGRLMKKGDAVTSLDGFFSVKAVGEKAVKRAKGVFIFKRPGYVYLEFISPLGTTKVVAGVDDQKIMILYPGEKEYFEGKATGENIERLFGFRLQPGEIFNIFSGQFIDFKEYGAVSFERDTLRGAVQGEALSMDGRHRICFWMKPLTGWLFTGFLTDMDDPRRELRVHYGDFQSIEGHDFPTRITIDKLGSPWRVTFKGKNVRVNGISDSKIFTLEPPDEGVLIPLERLDPEEPLFFGEESDEES